MSYKNKAILKDKNGIPIPQGYSPSIDDYEPVQTFNGAMLALASGNATENAVFHTNASTSGNGTSFVNVGLKNLTISIKGTAANTARTIVFEQSDVDGNWYPLVGVRNSDANVIAATETTGKDEVWQFDIVGITAIRMRISAITGGSITIKGKAVV